MGGGGDGYYLWGDVGRCAPHGCPPQRQLARKTEIAHFDAQISVRLSVVVVAVVREWW